MKVIYVIYQWFSVRLQYLHWRYYNLALSHQYAIHKQFTTYKILKIYINFILFNFCIFFFFPGGRKEEETRRNLQNDGTWSFKTSGAWRAWLWGENNFFLSFFWYESHKWWHHHMEKLAALCEGNLYSSNIELWCCLCCYNREAV